MLRGKNKMVAEIVPGNSLNLVRFEKAFEKRFDMGTNRILDRELQIFTRMLRNLNQKISNREASKGNFSKQQMEENDPQGPHVIFVIIRLTPEDLRRHVDWSSHGGRRHSIENLRGPKVANNQVALTNQNIRQFEISMQHVQFTQMPEPAHNMRKQQNRLLLKKKGDVATSHEVGQVALGAEIHDQVVVFAALEEFVESH